MVLERLAAYRRWSQHLPRHILFYRDNVSKSQYGEVRATELSKIQNACRKATQAGETEPLNTLVIVGKRHHARFYSTNVNERRNLDPGLIVDTDVFAPKQFNIYLQSHGSPKGTARSGHFVVLENGSRYTADELQSITNNICFMSSRATKGLSVCTPARYADLLCARLRMYMRPALEITIALHLWLFQLTLAPGGTDDTAFYGAQQWQTRLQAGGPIPSILPSTIS
ncbi:Protein argonaute, partial [Lachnellula subtilissima]